MLISLKTFNTI